MGARVCVCVHAYVHVYVSRAFACGFSFCAYFSPRLHMPGCPHVHTCTQDVSSSAHVDTDLGSNTCIAFPVLSPIRPECSLFHPSLPSLTRCPALLSALSSELEDSFSKEDEADFTHEPMGSTQSLTSTRESKACREGRG